MAIKDFTAPEVISMFRDELGLSVCDDQNLIEQKRKSKYQRYRRDEKSPDSIKRSRAQQWFKNIEVLRNRRSELLQVVYNYFALWADTVLSESINRGITYFDTEIEERLRKMLQNDCRVDADLENQFVNRYQQENGIKFGAILPDAVVAPVAIFNVCSSVGHMELSWELPDNCDRVEIKREVISKDHFQPFQIVYEGKDHCFTDRDIVAGIAYKYTIFNYHKKRKSSGNVQKTVAICEVKEIKILVKGSVHINWQLSNQNCSVLVKRTDINEQTQKNIYVATLNSLEDSDVQQGHSYTYLIKLDFGQGNISEGVKVQVKIPKAPPQVRRARAVYKFEEQKNIVIVSWQAVALPQVLYTVVRRQGKIPAAKIQDGEVIAKSICGTQFLDEKLDSGCRYIYSIFSEQENNINSINGTATNHVDIAPEVTGLKVKAGEKSVELQWQCPLNVHEVIVRRAQGKAPASYHEGVLVAAIGNSVVKDENLENSIEYHYRICCFYLFDQRPVYTKGITIHAIPERFPQPLEELSTLAADEEIICQWQKTGHGQAIIVKTKDALKYHHGKLIDTRELNNLGLQITNISENKAIDREPKLEIPYYHFFAVSGTQAIYGGSQICIYIPEIDGLKATINQDGCFLRWLWPQDCSWVIIARCKKDWPVGTSDSESTYYKCSRSEYEAAGGKYLDPTGENQGTFFYCIYRQLTHPLGEFYSSGKSRGCRQKIILGKKLVLKYKIQKKLGYLRLIWDIQGDNTEFTGFMIRASNTHIPSSREDGIELFRMESKTQKIKKQIDISLAPIQKQKWLRFFFKLMPLDNEQNIYIVHPNYATAISNKGEILKKELAPLSKRYHDKAPETIICPECFDQFPISDVLYTSYDGATPMPAKHTWLNKLLKKKPQAPRDKRGRLLTRKVCPKQHHDLPFTAGSQESLVIGLVGAVRSGKSHFIASLIHRLETQVGADFQASLLPVTPATHDRYHKEFYQVLFENNSELEKTVGISAPLIYDLTLDRSSWGEEKNRTVTLAFYDTAGENLTDPQRVQQMARYLEVAAGVVFLIDPLQSKQLYEIIPGHKKKSFKRVDPHTIFASVLELLKAREDISEHNLFSIPVAVALTKCDCLRDAGLIEQNRLWHSERRHRGYFDQELHQDISGLMEEYMQKWCSSAYQLVKSQFPRHSFFGVSATGSASNEKGYYPYVSPWRVEDPLLWVLAQLGVIDSQ